MVTELKILDGNTLFDKGANYVIPLYQRAYAWEDKEIIQLIDDINDIDSSDNYFIGSLIVSKTKRNAETYEVIDGQQRLTTLFLLLQYFVAIGELVGEVGQTLTFDCRANSKFTLSNIQKILSDILQKKSKNNYFVFENEDQIEQSILNGIKVICQKFESDKKLNIKEFVSHLQQVILYRIEVPENTDLNRYFEIMNTRGEQLEQHDILKAQLMKNLGSREEQEFFSKVWNACSDMTGYVQMHFSPRERTEIFGNEWGDSPSDDWNKYRSLYKTKKDTIEKGEKIKKIIAPKFNVNNVDGTSEDGTRIRFDSIIDFPYFLLHTLRVFVILHNIQLVNPLGELLDDKKLISDFKNVVENGSWKGKKIKNDKETFSKVFIIHLLRTRYRFDRYIIKREYKGDDNEGEWSLKELHSSGRDFQKKTYYTETKFKYTNYNEWEKTYSPRNEECLMIQSALRVSYTSPKIMHWITDLLLWLFDNNNELPEMIKKAEDIAAKATKENFLDGRNKFKLGVQTPHIVFNFLDYLLWKKNKTNYKDFVFEYRNSVEHWYPQNPSDGSFDSWNDKDTFGNLCIISRSVNSKFSNLSPESKMKSYSKIVNKGSLKLRIMGSIIQKFSNDD